MPHLSIEYSAGVETCIEMQAICASLYSAMLESRIFPQAGIRVRAYRADHVHVADGHPENNFVAMTLSVGAGRSKGDLQEAGSMIFAAAQAAFEKLLASPHFALSLEIREIDPDLSWKDTPIHARLSGNGGGRS